MVLDLDSIDIVISIILIFVFTVLIDLIDFRTLTNSFSFLTSFTYYPYLIWRFVFGFIAWIILSTTNLFINMDPIKIIILMPLLSAITSVTALQNFAFTLGYTDIIDLSAIFKGFKDKIVDEMITKDDEKNIIKANEKAKLYYKMINDLSEKIPLEILCSKCVYVLQEVYTREDPKLSEPLRKANEQVEKLKAEVSDQNLLKELLASEIVGKNSNYGKMILENAGVMYG